MSLMPQFCTLSRLLLNSLKHSCQTTKQQSKWCCITPLYICFLVLGGRTFPSLLSMTSVKCKLWILVNLLTQCRHIHIYIYICMHVDRSHSYLFLVIIHNGSSLKLEKYLMIGFTSVKNLHHISSIHFIKNTEFIRTPLIFSYSNQIVQLKLKLLMLGMHARRALQQLSWVSVCVCVSVSLFCLLVLLSVQQEASVGIAWKTQ